MLFSLLQNKGDLGWGVVGEFITLYAEPAK